MSLEVSFDVIHHRDAEITEDAQRKAFNNSVLALCPLCLCGELFAGDLSLASSEQSPILEMLVIKKTFPCVRALDGVTFDLHAGEIHALVGENGAGKSTLMKVLGGVYPYPEYGGEIRINGAVQRFGNIRQAEGAGIAVVFQELSLVKDMTVGENIFLGREPRKFGIVRWDELYRRAHQLLTDLRLSIDPRTPVRNLGIGQQQLVEIAKALSQNARILVLDEPTAALTESEVETLVA
ncbi:MAG: D-xylose transport system ATP-binding protein, partial [Blastocatellia bacterium]|nr:D-xylose transport system ATP-binding protein [Blastocatellia bacterium]